MPMGKNEDIDGENELTHDGNDSGVMEIPATQMV